MVDKTQNIQQPERIVEFESVLESMLVDENHVWGKKNKPRNFEPSMFDLLKWNEMEPNIHDFKSNNRALLKSSDIVKYKQQINRSNTAWKTESQDAFRKFVFSPSKKTTVFQEMDDEIKDKLVISQKARPLSAENGRQISHQHQAIICKDGEIIPEEIYFESLDPKFTSDYLDKFSLKNIENHSDLQRQLDENTKNYQNYKDKLQSKIYLSQSDKKNNKKLVPKKVQVKPFKYDKSGNLIGDPEQYYQDVWCEVDENNEFPNKNKDDEEDSEQSEQEENSNNLFKNGKKVKTNEDDEDLDVNIKKEDYSAVKSKLFSTKTVKKAKILDPVLEKDKLDRRKQRIKKFSEQTKWLPNTAFTTYYGKPAFENYGRGNVRPANGGIIYGNYLKTHNVNPHRGKKNPNFKQSYNNALMYGSRMPVCEPELPRKVTEDFRLSQKHVDSLKNRTPLSPDPNIKEVFENQKIIKPDLINSLRFASEENTPTNSPTMRGMGKTSLSNLQKQQKAIRKKLASKSAKKNPIENISKSLSQKLHKEMQVQTVTVNENDKKKQKHQKNNAQGGQEHSREYEGDFNQISKKNGLVETVQLSTNKANPEIIKTEKVKNLLNEQSVAPQAPAKMKLSKKDRKKEKERLEALENEEKIYPEHAAKLQKKFIKSLKEKKEYSNRIVPKVTEVYPIIQVNKEKSSKIKDKESPEKIISIDEMNPPKGYIGNLSPNELNPKFYKHIPAVWMKRIPYAGKYIEKDPGIKDAIQPK